MRFPLSITCGLLLLLGLMIGCSGGDDGQEGETQMEEKAQKAEATEVSLEDKRSDIRSDDNPIVTIETDFGKMVLELYRDVAPGHADSFVARTSDGFYNGLTFHRIVEHFMIQGGDPSGNGTGNAGYYLDAEFSDLPHQEGTLSMARSRSPNSASCQFFICLARNRSTESLDGQYTVFGQLLKGYDVLHKVAGVAVEANPMNPREISKPVQPVYMKRLYLSDAEGDEISG